MTAERPTADGTVEHEPDGSTTIRFHRGSGTRSSGSGRP